jgi:hypothetical protein
VASAGTSASGSASARQRISRSTTTAWQGGRRPGRRAHTRRAVLRADPIAFVRCS